MSKKYCPRCSSNHTKKMEKGTENKDINVIIADTFFKIIEAKRTP